MIKKIITQASGKISSKIIKKNKFEKESKQTFIFLNKLKVINTQGKGVINLPWSKIFLGIALIATITGGLFATKTLAGIDKNLAAVKEAQRPANVKLTKIITPNCSSCFNVDEAVNLFKKQNILVGGERTIQFDSSEAQSLIKELGIKRLPTYIATGEVSKNNLKNFVINNGQVKNGTFAFTKVTPVFIDPETKKEMGKVTATILTDPTCNQCLDPKLTVEQFKKANVKIVDQKEVVWNSDEGQKLISQYKITKLPTFLFSSDIDVYDDIKANWSNLGTIEPDKTYVARNLFLPYRDLEKGQILGLVNLIYLIDSSCADCYKVDTVQKPILVQYYGVGINSEQTVDISSGKGQNLVDRYKITKVPTILLSPEASQYITLKNVWKNVGTVESDGWYVFREMQQLGKVVYKDLSTNQIMGRVQASPIPNTNGVNQ